MRRWPWALWPVPDDILKEMGLPLDTCHLLPFDAEREARRLLEVE